MIQRTSDKPALGLVVKVPANPTIRIVRPKTLVIQVNPLEGPEGPEHDSRLLKSGDRSHSAPRRITSVARAGITPKSHKSETIRALFTIRELKNLLKNCMATILIFVMASPPNNGFKPSFRWRRPFDLLT
jgi:hypothetical protein